MSRPIGDHPPANGRLLAIVAHPDDETFGCGSTLAYAATAGYQVVVCCATLGELGEAAPRFDLGDRSLAECRYDEFRAAAAILGAEPLPPLGLMDSGWDGPPAADSLCGVPFDELVRRIRDVIMAQQPDIVLTISGDDGHRDHRRLAEAVTAAFPAAGLAASLYQWCLPNRLMRRWADEIARIRPGTAHLAMADLGTPDEAFTTIIDTSEQLDVRRRAIAAYSSQVSPYDGLSAELAHDFLTTDHLVRVFPAPDPPGGRSIDRTLRAEPRTTCAAE